MTNKELKDYLDKLDTKLEKVEKDVNDIIVTLREKDKNEKRKMDIKLIVWGLIISAGNIGVRFVWR